MDPLVKKLLNSLRCPICKGQLDLMSYAVSSKPKKYNFSCVYDFRHYGIFLNHWDLPPVIHEEGVIIFEQPYRFDILQENNNTQIIIYETDLEERVIDNIKPKVFKYDKLLFNFSKTSREKILNRIKTILVFQ